MNNIYFIDLSKYSLEAYENILKNSELLPGRRILSENLAQRFEKLSNTGIQNLEELSQALKTTKRIQQLASESSIPEEYLKILKRELKKFLPKPVSLHEFPGINPEIITGLRQSGIRNTLQLFPKADTKIKQEELAWENGFSIKELNELVKLADISRIWGVGPVFCRIFYESGYDTVEKIAHADARELFRHLTEINQKMSYTTARFTLKDIQLCIHTAQDLPKTIEHG